MWVRPIVAALFALAAAREAAALTVDELPSGVYAVRAVRIEGVSWMTARTLADVMVTKVPPWYQPWKRWRQKVTFNPQIFRTDLDRVATALRESGHFEAVVTHDLEVDGEDMTIVITVDDGPAANVDTVDLVFTDFTPTEAESLALRNRLTLRAGDVFT